MYPGPEKDPTMFEVISAVAVALWEMVPGVLMLGVLLAVIVTGLAAVCHVGRLICEAFQGGFL